MLTDLVTAICIAGAVAGIDPEDRACCLSYKNIMIINISSRVFIELHHHFGASLVVINSALRIIKYAPIVVK